MQDYVGYGKATKPMLPMIAIPTTSGTGSEAQSYAVISDAETHAKMAVRRSKAAFRVALLDPALTLSQPNTITATAGFDAIRACGRDLRYDQTNSGSQKYSRAPAWKLLEPNFEVVLSDPNNLTRPQRDAAGAYFAGVAIEGSMLGATHACANPLTAHYGTTHGAAWRCCSRPWCAGTS
jgi:alcohol dehydrogenase